jgi:glucose-1-phosphate thymidylyltransferase
MLGGITKILIISTPNDLPFFRDMLMDGSQWGIDIQYVEQTMPEGIPQAFILGEKFIRNESIVLILGDNLYYGYYNFFRNTLTNHHGATIFGYYVNNPQRYGVIEFTKSGKVASIEEKPSVPKSNYVVTGLYVYDERVVDIAKSLKPSKRGELEITDVNMAYWKLNELRVEIIGRGIAWLDTGTPESLLEAANFISTLKKRQGLEFGCPEEIALRMGYIDGGNYRDLVKAMPECSYRNYLEQILKDPIKTWEIAI